MTLQPLFPETIPAVLQSASDRLVLAARSPATLRAYRTDWSAFVAWCHAQDVTALPARPETVAAWIASRLEQGRKAATLARGVAAVSCAHELAGFESFSRSRVVHDALRGMRRTLGTAPTRKAPATVDLLRRMLDIQPDTLIGRRNRALLALGFAGALRRSELAMLDVGDLVPQEGGALLAVRRSKTDTDGAGQTIGILNGSTIRALEHVSAWCEASGITSGRLFRSVDGVVCGRGR
ncbi:tyrosine-type recombinase/integrase, partial [Gluconobacter oxydans]